MRPQQRRRLHREDEAERAAEAGQAVQLDQADSRRVAQVQAGAGQRAQEQCSIQAEPVALAYPGQAQQEVGLSHAQHGGEAEGLERSPQQSAQKEGLEANRQVRI